MNKKTTKENKERITITINAEILRELDSDVENGMAKNRSVAIENRIKGIGTNHTIEELTKAVKQSIKKETEKIIEAIKI